MKKKSIILSAMACSTILSTSALAANSNYVVVDNDEGTVVLTSVYVENNNDGEPSIALEMTATVKTAEANTPYGLYTIYPFQNGKQLDYTTAKIDTLLYDKTNNNLFTSLKNGASEDFGDMFLLADESNVEIEFHSSLDDIISTDAPEAVEGPDYKAMYEELKVEYDELLKKYNELVK